MITIPDTTAVLSRAAVFDQRVPKPNPTVISGWAEEFNRNDLDVADLLAGVSDYYSIGRDRVIQPGDVIRAARDLRQRRAQIDNTQQARTALPAGHEPNLDGTGLNATGQPVDAAYEVHNAGHLQCPTCHAGPGEVCEHPADGRTMRIPHAARLAAAYRATSTCNPEVAGASFGSLGVR